MARETRNNVEPEVNRPGFFRRLIRTIFLVVFLVALAFGGSTLYLYSEESGKKPWEWDGAGWKAWWAYTTSRGKEVGNEMEQQARKAKDKAVEYSNKAIDKVKAIEWSKLGDTISEKTKSLFGQTEEVVQKIEENRKETASGYEPKFPGEAGQAFDYGLVAMEDGIRFWKVSLVEGSSGQQLDAKATEKAVKKFNMAVNNFEQAKQLKADLTPDLDTFLQQAKDFQAESVERQKKIEELLKNQPAATPAPSLPTEGAPAPAPAEGAPAPAEAAPAAAAPTP